MPPQSREWDSPQYLQQLAQIIAHLIIERRLNVILIQMPKSVQMILNKYVIADG